jgi:hypothetical protein
MELHNNLVSRLVDCLGAGSKVPELVGDLSQLLTT